MNITEITYTTDADNCGDNSDAENRRYAHAVKAAIQSEYPEAAVAVELSRAVVRDTEFNCDDDNDYLREYDTVCNDIKAIANHVWDKSAY